MRSAKTKQLKKQVWLRGRTSEMMFLFFWNQEDLYIVDLQFSIAMVDY